MKPCMHACIYRKTTSEEQGMRCIYIGPGLNTGEGIQADEQQRERERSRDREREHKAGLHQLNSIYSIRALLYSVSRCNVRT